jgi:DNA replication and repair protein RecF
VVRLTRLRLRDFRNYERLDVEFPPGIVLLTGPNGAGKSNLLEAIHYLSYLRSFRGARDRDVLRHGSTYAAIDASLLDDHERPFDARLVLKGGKRFVRLNGQPVTRFQDFIGRLHSQFFFPGDLSLLTGDPALRREVLDLELLRLKPQLTPLLRGYGAALAERNRVLKLLHPGPSRGGPATHPGRSQTGPSPELGQALEVYTAQLVAAGTQLMRERRGLARVLDSEFTRLYGALAPPGGESASLRYITGVELEPDAGIAAAFRSALAQAADAEASLRYTTVGPHRDDLGFLLDGKRDMRRFASQGQLRSAALCFRLALCQLSARRLADDPLLLLDDALSEMDDERKQRLLALCRRHRQVFITSASAREAEQVLPLAAAVLRVEAGTVAVRD